MSPSESNDPAARRRSTDRRPDQLPRGRHGLDRETVAASQQTRIVNAMIEVAGRDGFSATRVTEVISRAGLSRKAFYEHFDDKEHCFVAAYEHAITPLFTLALRASESQDRYADRVRAALAALLNALAQDPAAARVSFVEVLAAGPAAVAKRNEVMQNFVREFTARSKDVDPRIREVAMISLVGGITEVLYQTISAGNAETLPDLLPQLMYAAVLPIVGLEAAEREITRGERPPQ